MAAQVWWKLTAKGAVSSPEKRDFTVYFAMFEFLMLFKKFPTFYLTVIVWESVPGAKSCRQPIWLKLGTEVGCDEIFQKPLRLTSLTFSFGVTGGTGGGGGGLIFCPLSTKSPAFQGAFWKCHKTTSWAVQDPTGMLALLSYLCYHDNSDCNKTQIINFLSLYNTVVVTFFPYLYSCRHS